MTANTIHTTPRECFLRALNYTGPDRLPVVYSTSPAGRYVHGQKLIDLFERYPSDNPVVFTNTAVPPPETIDAQGRYHEFKTDDWGTEWEYTIFGIAGHPFRYPITDWDMADDYHLPPLPSPTGPDFERTRAAVQQQRERYFMMCNWVSIFERLHALHPMDGVLMALASEEPGLLRLLERLEHYWTASIDYQLATGMDAIWFGDDWGTQTATIISPAMFRDIFRPIYERLFARIKQKGGRVFFHSCGALDSIFDELLDMGIDLIWPQIRWFESDPNRIAACRERRVAFYVHPDRQKLIPFGTPAEIRADIIRYIKLGRELGGGVVFNVEIENDAPFENVQALVETIAEFR